MERKNRALASLTGVAGVAGLLTLLGTCNDNKGEKSVGSQTPTVVEEEPMGKNRRLRPFPADFEEAELTQRGLTARLKDCIEQDLQTEQGSLTVECRQKSPPLEYLYEGEEPKQADILLCTAKDENGQTLQTTNAYLGPITVEGDEGFTAYTGHAIAQGRKGTYIYETDSEPEIVGDLESLEGLLDDTCISAREQLKQANPQLAQFQFYSEVLRDFVVDEGGRVDEMSVSTMPDFSGEGDVATGFISGSMPEEGVQFQCVLTSVDYMDFEGKNDGEGGLSCLTQYTLYGDREMPLIQSSQSFPAEAILEDPDSVVLPLSINPNLSSDPSTPGYKGPIQGLE